MWIASNDQKDIDIHAAFRGNFQLTHDTEVIINFSGATSFVIWLDGELFVEGPTRFDKNSPVYQSKNVKLLAGNHILAAHVYNEGIETRRMQEIEPFFLCKVYEDEIELAINWKCKKLEGYKSAVRRLGACLGWIEWCNHSENPVNWKSFDFKDFEWDDVCEDKYLPGRIIKQSIGEPLNMIKNKLSCIAHGDLADMYGYEFDDIPTKFFLRDNVCNKMPSQGIWFRYDIGYVRLFKPLFLIDAPKGSVIEFAYSEYLMHNRVTPYITLMGSASCNLDHYIAPGGLHEYMPATSRGGRFIEVHILYPVGYDKKDVKILKSQYLHICTHQDIKVPFTCDNQLLNEIWFNCAQTYRSCAEDVIVDCPVRERGQWVGDNVNVGMKVASALYSDISISKKCLINAVDSLLEDGRIPSNFPGQCGYIPSFALQWVEACYSYYYFTGDKQLLENLYQTGVNNVEFFEKFITEIDNNKVYIDHKKLIQSGIWNFIDWGYAASDEVDIALNIIYLRAVIALIKCSDILNINADNFISRKVKIEKVLIDVVSMYKNDLQRIGFHGLSLMLAQGLLTEEDVKLKAIEFIKKHIMNSFPNNPKGVRLANPSVVSNEIITPYFLHYVLPALIDNNEIEFVLKQYESCWGWMIKNGHTTCLEVFDERWSHCHQWSASPAWQLNKYVLGLYPCFDKGENCFNFTFKVTHLNYANGFIPINNTKNDGIKVNWIKKGKFIEYNFKTSKPIIIYFGNEKQYFNKGEHCINIPL